MAGGHQLIVRHYKGRLDVAMAAFEADAARAALMGYQPVSQVYEPGSWGCGAFLLAAASMLLFGIGILILAYLIIVKPAGTLAVTYQWREDVTGSAPPSTFAADAWQR